MTLISYRCRPPAWCRATSCRPPRLPCRAASLHSTLARWQCRTPPVSATVPAKCTAPVLVMKSLFELPLSLLSVTVGNVSLGSVVSTMMVCVLAVLLALPARSVTVTLRDVLGAGRQRRVERPVAGEHRRPCRAACSVKHLHAGNAGAATVGDGAEQNAPRRCW